ncbi:Regulatory protein BlaR1 [Symmachiella dynata]|uniref:M56 family metallopeptidase n=1 Tax=Symmachiella dynata TaxID=2527995 RepID=UPI00118901AE|nr:M56 family metallopeptidase [Symmachiella dynata]QDT50103.1 Regulatory protein BlaR1 [Symmachiella dynata]
MTLLNVLPQWLDPTTCAHLVSALLHFLWQATALCAMAIGVSAVLKGRAARSRYLVNLCCLLAMAVCVPVNFWLVTHIPKPLDGTEVQQPTGVSVADARVAEPKELATVAQEAVDRASLADKSVVPATQSIPLAISEPMILEEHLGDNAAAILSGWSGEWAVWIVAVWIGGALCMLARLTLALCAGWRLARGALPVTEPTLLTFARLQSQHIGLSVSPVLAWCDRVSVPVVVGIIRPMILLPPSLLTGLEPIQWEAILVHEFAHIRRWDSVLNALQRLIEACYFFHPAIWYVSRRVSAERENCCDDIVVRNGVNRVAYADALVSMAEICASQRIAATSLAATGGSQSDLKRRVLRLLNAESRQKLLPGGSPAMLLVLGILMFCSFGLWQLPTAAQQQEPPQANQNAQSADDGSLGAGAQASPDDPPIQHADPQMAAMIQAVREQERRYHNLETVVRQTTGYEEGKWTIQSQTETNRAIRQGELLFFEGKDVTRLSEGGGGKIQRRVSAFDGRRTVSIEYDRCANIHLRRYEPSEMLPPHTWGLLGLDVNFPLSIYLQGGAALDTHPKVRRYPFPMGYGFEIYKTHCEHVGTEQVGNFQCEKIRVRCWNRHSVKDRPSIEYLWLTPERNYHCVKSQRVIDIAGKEHPIMESTVEEFSEIAPGLWLPKLVSGRRFDRKSIKQGQPKATQTETLKLKNAQLDPKYPAAQFSVTIPDNMDVFTIDADGITDGPHHPQPATPAKSTTLAEIIATLRQHEALYEDIDYTVAERWFTHEPVFNTISPNEINDRWIVQKLSKRRRSVSADGNRYFEQESDLPGRNGPYTVRRLAAFDGQWTRSVTRNNRRDEKSFRVIGAYLSGRKSFPIYRPHTISPSITDDGRALSDFLSSQFQDINQKTPHRVVYEGDNLIDGLVCHRIRGDLMIVSKRKIPYVYRMWLARDRNLLPIRSGWVPPSRRSTKFPTGICVTTDFQELEPGVWMPMTWTKTYYNETKGRGLCEDRMIENGRNEYHIESVTLNPEIDPQLFQAVNVPEGVKFSIYGADGKHLGARIQPEDGNMSISDEEYRKLNAP